MANENKKEIKEMEVVLFCDYLDRELILARIKGTNMFQLFYKSAGLSTPVESPKGSTYPIFGVCDPNYLFGNYLISLYEEIYQRPFDMGAGWIFKLAKDKTSIETYWGLETYRRFCMNLEKIPTQTVGMKVSYETFMNVCNDILLYAKDEHRFIAKAYKKDIVERLLSNIEM